jgi:hypothetical protein
VLSSARCRALLGPDCALTEAQLEQLRQDLHALAEVAVESLSRDQLQRATKTHHQLEPTRGTTAAALNGKGAASLDAGYEAAERVAILEFDAGMCRSDAEEKVKSGSKKRAGNWTKPRL